MNGKPSYLTSTFSTVTLMVTAGLTYLCIRVRDVATLKEVALLILGSYSVKKGMEFARNGQEPKPPLPPIVPPIVP